MFVPPLWRSIVFQCGSRHLVWMCLRQSGRWCRAVRGERCTHWMTVVRRYCLGARWAGRRSNRSPRIRLTGLSGVPQHNSTEHSMQMFAYCMGVRLRWIQSQAKPHTLDQSVSRKHYGYINLYWLVGVLFNSLLISGTEISYDMTECDVFEIFAIYYSLNHFFQFRCYADLIFTF